MKNIAICCLFLISCLQVSGQWYVKKYQVNDINLLTQNQLEESLLESKTSLLLSGAVTAVAGLSFVYFKYWEPGVPENPTLVEELLGDDGVNMVGVALSAGVAVIGTISCIVSIGRSGTIRSTLKKELSIHRLFKAFARNNDK